MEEEENPHKCLECEKSFHYSSQLSPSGCCGAAGTCWALATGRAAAAGALLVALVVLGAPPGAGAELSAVFQRMGKCECHFINGTEKCPPVSPSRWCPRTPSPAQAAYPAETQLSWFQGQQELPEHVVATDVVANGEWTHQLLVLLETTPGLGSATLARWSTSTWSSR
ncbi:uncharacterized protein M8220_016918 [Acridotheres tristis]